MEEGQIRKRYKMRESSLERLTEARLLRKETRPGLEGFYYELSHDSLTGPVMKSRRFGEKIIKYSLVVSVIVAVILAIAGSWLWLKGYTVDHAVLKVQSAFVSIHVVPEMVEIPGGAFQMGNEEKIGDPGYNLVHPVTIKPFAMGRHEVTFEEYDRFTIATGRPLPDDQGWGRGRRPVINVSWEEAKAYAEWLSRETGNHYRLPTESEWEYAARSGAKQEVWAGTSQESEVDAYAVFVKNSGYRSAEVGTKRANGFDLHDLGGNVWEWVEDCWHENYKHAPRDGSAWLETSGGSCGQRVIRGGSWSSNPDNLRASWRLRYRPVNWDDDIGFRLVQDIS